MDQGVDQGEEQIEILGYGLVGAVKIGVGIGEKVKANRQIFCSLNATKRMHIRR